MQNVWPILIYAAKSRSGKDFAGSELQRCSTSQMRYYRAPIADSLKDFCWHYFKQYGVRLKSEYEYDPEIREDELDIEGGGNVVDLWIKVGEFFRGLDKEFWISRWWTQVRSSTQGSQPEIIYPVITDWRFDCELEYLQKLVAAKQLLGFTTVRINVAADKGVAKASDGKVTVKKFDLEVCNDFTPLFQKEVRLIHEHVRYACGVGAHK